MNNTCEMYDDISTEDVVSLYRELYYDDESNVEAAEEYATQLDIMLIEKDDDRTLSKTKRELEYLHSRFQNDRVITECLANCYGMWGIGKRKTTLEKAKKEMLLMKDRFPDSEEIAENYSDIIVYLSREETSIEICNSYMWELDELKTHFENNSTIKENYEELEQIIEEIKEYLACFQKRKVSQEKYVKDSCLENAIEYADSLCDLISAEKDNTKCHEYVEIINFLVNTYSDCIKLIELKSLALYYASASYDEMQKASAIIHAILKKYPLNEEIAENYVLLLDSLCEDYQDENEIKGLVRKIKEYHQLYPNNLTITTSFASVLSVYIEVQTIAGMEKTLDLIWTLSIQNLESKDILDIYEAAFDTYTDTLADDKNIIRLFIRF